MAKAAGKEQGKINDAPLWLWGIALLGLVLALGSIGFMLYEAVAGDKSPPEVTLQVDAIVPVHNGFLVQFRARNEGGTTAKSLEIEGVLKNGAATVETSNVNFEYLPPHSERSGGLFFTLDPQQYALALRAVGYEVP